MYYSLDSKDIGLLEQKGIDQQQFDFQLDLLNGASQKTQLKAAATIGEGVQILSEEEIDSFVHAFDHQQKDLDLLKFVPASGAASRMFKDLAHYSKSGEPNEGVTTFFSNIERFPFFRKELKDIRNQRKLIERLLHEPPFEFLSKAKGSIPFHRYDGKVLTAFDEHLFESLEYAWGREGVKTHFTLPPDKKSEILEALETSRRQMEDGEHIKITSSTQLSQTDTVSLDEEGNLIRTEHGIVFRPGGHGSLIHNLNHIKEDLIFIKNIDNVAPASKRTQSTRYKKALAMMLLDLKDKAREVASKLQDGVDIIGARRFIEDCGTRLTSEPTVAEMLAILNRPYRVCGMVKNEGEPGGGPFWVKTDGGTSLQIIESAQIDRLDSEQIAIMEASTHFNPVDIVLSQYDLKGKKIDLLKHVDLSSSFVTHKQVNGINAKVLEWPGLWNGAMADWNTVFVQVPLAVFNPVKTVNDLLRDMHQA